MREGYEQERRKQREKGHGPVIDKMCQEMCQERGPKFRTLQAIARHLIGFPMLSWLDVERNEDMGKIKGLGAFSPFQEVICCHFLARKGRKGLLKYSCQ